MVSMDIYHNGKHHERIRLDDDANMNLTLSDWHDLFQSKGLVKKSPSEIALMKARNRHLAKERAKRRHDQKVKRRKARQKAQQEQGEENKTPPKQEQVQTIHRDEKTKTSITSQNNVILAALAQQQERQQKQKAATSGGGGVKVKRSLQFHCPEKPNIDDDESLLDAAKRRLIQMQSTVQQLNVIKEARDKLADLSNYDRQRAKHLVGDSRDDKHRPKILAAPRVPTEVPSPAPTIPAAGAPSLLWSSSTTTIPSTSSNHDEL